MRFLIDANLSPRVAVALTAAGHDATHVFDHQLGKATDEVISAAALADDRVIISSDTDFGALLALHDRTKPSFILLRHVNELRPDQHTQLILANVDAVADDLDSGAVVTIDRARLRIRRLPIV